MMIEAKLFRVLQFQSEIARFGHVKRKILEMVLIHSDALPAMVGTIKGKMVLLNQIQTQLVFPVSWLIVELNQSEILAILSGGNDLQHDFSVMLRTDDLNNLASFIQDGMIDDNLIHRYDFLEK